MSKEHLLAIFSYHKRGMPIPAIGKTSKLHQEQLQRVVMRFLETKRIECHQRKGDREQQGLKCLETWSR